MIPRTIFSEEHDAYRSMVRRFVANEVVPHHRRWQEAGVISDEGWRKAGAAGLLCPMVPEEWGGAGADYLYSAIVIEELAYADVADVGFYSHSDVSAPYLVNYGTDEQKRRWLPRMVSGESRVSLAMTEPSAGSDVAGIKTTARRDGDEYVINGQKVFISLGSHAELFIVACKTDPSAGRSGISLILVEPDRRGFARGKPLEKMGLKCHDAVELFFDDVRIPVQNLLGSENCGFAQMMAQLPQERLMQAVRAVAVAERVLDGAVAYTSNRQAFGQAIADMPTTQFRFADAWAAITAQRVLVDRCLELHVNNALDAVDAAVVKLSSTEMQGQVVDQCLQLYGGWGYMMEQPIARAYVDARVARIAGGSTDIMKQIIGRQLVRQSRVK